MTEVARSKQRTDVLVRFADQALVSIGNFLVGILVARFVGPLQFGAFALFWTIVVFTLSGSWAITIAPMQSTISALRPDKIAYLLVSLIGLTIALALIGAGVGLMVAVWSTSVALSIGAAAAFCSVAFFVIVQDFSRRWLLATEHAGLALAGDAMKQAGALSTLLYFGHSDLKVCLAILAGTAAAGCVPLFPELRKAAFKPAYIREHWLQHLKIGKWLVFSVTVQAIATSLPIYALGIEAGVVAAGGYRAVSNLLAPIVSLTEALETFLPLRSRQAILAGGTPALRHFLWWWWWPCQLLCLSFGLATWAAGPMVLRLVFGAAYVGYAPLLAPLAIALNLQFASYILHVALRTVNRVRLIPRADIAATLTMLALFVFIPIQHGLVWAAGFVAVYQAIKISIWAYSARDILTASQFMSAS